MLHKKYDNEKGPVPEYEISKDLSYLTIAFIISSVIYFLVAGFLALLMRTIQSKGIVFENLTQTTGLFYTSLTIHGQLMFFGFASMLTIGISYFLISKFARKPLFSMRFAIWSFSLMNAGAIFLIISATMFFGGGWYNLMPLAFHPGNNGWTTLSAVIFLMADVIIGVALVIFCINIIATVLKGKIAAGLQKTEQPDDDIHKYKSDEDDGGRVDLLPLVNMPSSIRWISILGISSWFPIKYRSQIPAVSIVVVGVFINALVMLVGTPGLFSQLSVGFSYLLDPNFDPNWLFAKDAWWFFGHPIVYFTLFSFLAAAYYYIPRYTKKTVPYDKWAYRSWPFYFIFTMLVFSHHTYLDMPNPAWVEMIAQVASFGIIFPSALTIMTILMYVFRSRINWNVTSMFMMTGIVGWAYGGFTGTETGWWGTNIYLHNTLNVVGHIHFVLLMGSVLLGLGLIYSIVPAITGKNLNNNLGVIHLITTAIGGFGLAFLFTNLGFEGFVRREAIAPDQFAWSMPWLIFFAFTVGLGQIIFAYNLFRTLKHGQWFKSNGLYYAAGISTSLAGILHLVLVQYFVGFDSLTSTFFIVSGLVQIFWLVPFLRKWGRIWYVIGIVGTVALIVLFVSSQASGETGLDWKFILFYLVVGGAQLFWIIPLILRWSKARFYVGIVSAILVSLFWIITNSPESIVGVEAPYDDLSIFIEGLQVIFIVTSVMVILRGGSLWPEKNIDSSRGSDHGSSNVGQPSTQELDI